MRIRNYRLGDSPTLVHIQHLAARTDEAEAMSATDFEQWLTEPELEAEHNIFVVTDDDESNTWGQAEVLEGIEGEIIGYTVLQFRRSQHTCHFLCVGTVHPSHRRRMAGQALLICALNRARVRATEIEFAEGEEPLVYFEALLPPNDAASEHLATKCELVPTDEQTSQGMRLYRSELWY